MSRFLLTISLVFLASYSVFSQSLKVRGKITNMRQEALAYVSIQVRELKAGYTGAEDGTYSIDLNPGKYDLLISMIGYKPQLLTVIVRNEDVTQDVMMEEDTATNLSEVIIRTKLKDRSEEYISNVIKNKDAILAASGPYSCKIYIRATQEDSMVLKNKKKEVVGVEPIMPRDIKSDLSKMAMSEVLLRYDQQSQQKIREERLAVTNRGDVRNLFYLSTTEGDFNFYNNLIKTRSLAQIPFLSPISYSGLLAYRFKTIKTERIGKRRIYTISVRPRLLSNATVEGEITIADSSWVILHTHFTFPSYLMPEYDYFEVEQDYGFVDSTAWMIKRQQFTYYSKSGKGKLSGQTIANYRDFELNKQFEKKHFGTEISATAKQAYQKDSLFWAKIRPEPLTVIEARFIQYQDSMFVVTHTEAYLDSMDRVINKVTWKRILVGGQSFSDHQKEKRWYFPPAITIFQPLQFGGSRIHLAAAYFRTYPSRRSIIMRDDLSYGLRNHDLNGKVYLYRLYDPIRRGDFYIQGGRQFENIFTGDAWINLLKRSNIYLNNFVGAGHRIELLNGLYLRTDAEFALRRSVANYKTNPKVDSLFPDLLTNNQAVLFEPYNAFYGVITLEFTPRQKFIREPREKVIVGSAFPTFYATIRKGLPGIFGSVVDFNYYEFGIRQQVKLGLAGISKYTIRSGSFGKTTDLRMIDYQFQRRGEPLWFQNPDRTFQALDSTFPLFHRFYEMHYVHEFNGALINKIPFMKKIGLREIIGGGFLIAPEKHMRYLEGFAGIERVFKSPFDPLGKYKIGIYIVGSTANNFKNPIQIKIGLTSWDKILNRWY